jgi:hypothetical protein
VAGAWLRLSKRPTRFPGKFSGAELEATSARHRLGVTPLVLLLNHSGDDNPMARIFHLQAWGSKSGLAASSMNNVVGSGTTGY